MSELVKAAKKAREWADKRDRLIRENRAAGMTLRDIAVQAGVSHTQVANICAETPETL